MYVGLLIMALLLFCPGVTLIVYVSFGRPWRPHLTERLRPFFQPPSVADEAEAWLKRQ